jgi:hypothetical protein
MSGKRSLPTSARPTWTRLRPLGPVGRCTLTPALATILCQFTGAAAHAQPAYPTPAPYPAAPAQPSYPPQGPPPPAYPAPGSQPASPPYPAPAQPVPPGYPPQAPAPEAPPPPAPEAPAEPDATLPETGYGLYPARGRYYALPPEQEPTLDRRGLVIEVGFAMGGIFEPEDGRFGLGYDLAIGGVLNRYFAFMFDYSTLTYSVGQGDRATHAVFGGMAQFFLGSRTFFKAGAGIAQLSPGNGWGFSLDAAERTFAGMAGFGVEVYQQQPDFAIDVQFRGAGGRYREFGWLFNAAVMMGVNFY